MWELGFQVRLLQLLDNFVFLALICSATWELCNDRFQKMLLTCFHCGYSGKINRSLFFIQKPADVSCHGDKFCIKTPISEPLRGM